MSWLKAIENILGAGEGGVNTKSQIRMVRAIRELVRYVRVLRSTDDAKEQIIAYDEICSPDAKELLK